VPTRPLKLIPARRIARSRVADIQI
jgi:hypothetical protein